MIKTMTAEEYEKQYGVKPQTSTKTPLTPTKQKKNKGVVDNVLDIGSAVANFIGARGMANQFGASLAEATVPKDQKRFVEYPSEKEVVGSAIQTGALLAPGGGASTAAKIATGAATGYGMDVGSKLQEGETVVDAMKPGGATAVGAALPILGRIIGGFPKAMEQANLRMTTTERINLKKQGKDVADYLARKKIVGSPEQRFQKVSSLYDQMENVIGNKVSKSGASYNKADIIAELKTIPDKEFGDDIIGYDDAVKGMDAIVKFIETKAPDVIPAKLLNTYKRALYKRAYSKNNTDVLNETLHSAGSLFKTKLDKTVDGLQALNNEYGNLLTARKILFKATERAQTGLADRTLGTVGGAALGSAGGPVGAAIGAIVGEKASKLVGNTTTRSAAGATVQTLNDIVSKIPKDAAGNLQITEKALMLMLQDALE